MNHAAAGPMRLDRDRVENALGSLVRAFEPDPVWVEVLAGVKKRERAMRALFGFMLRYGSLYGEVYVPSPAGEGAAIWLPPEYATTDGPDALRAGVFSVPFALGMKAMGRLQSFGKLTVALRKRHCPEEYRYLAVLGVDPAHQGRGIGRRLLDPLLERSAKEGLPVWLETETESNVEMYRHFGFEVMEESRPEGIDVPLWGMLKNV